MLSHYTIHFALLVYLHLATLSGCVFRTIAPRPMLGHSFLALYVPGTCSPGMCSHPLLISSFLSLGSTGWIFLLLSFCAWGLPHVSVAAMGSPFPLSFCYKIYIYKKRKFPGTRYSRFPNYFTGYVK